MKQKISLLFAGILIYWAGGGTIVFAYPVDGYEITEIRRLVRQQLIYEKKMTGPLLPPGGYRHVGDIRLNLVNRDCDLPQTLPATDPDLLRKIKELFSNRDGSYSLAVLDISAGLPQRFAQYQADQRFPVGSIGKLAVVAGLFTELKNLFPESTEKRRELLRHRMVKAGRWILSDDHEVPVFDPQTKAFEFREIREGDLFSLYEWTDHMLSASANSAASTVWKEVVLMRHFGQNYPPSEQEETDFFKKFPRKQLGELAMNSVNEPLRAINIAQAEFQLGNFFTREGKNMVPGIGESYASPLGLIKYLVALEKGQIVDEWSSLEIKRLMYMTAKRIRYASAPRLSEAAVYFKSGSLYQCKPEAGFKCGKYQGNVKNVMNSVAIVEHPDGRTYLVALMSNVLKINSAVEHQTIATYLEKLLKELYLKATHDANNQPVTKP